MILGYIHVDDEHRTLDTHRDSFLLDTLTVVSVRRPFFVGGLMFGAGFLGFTASFADLLYPHEIAITLSCGAFAFYVGWQVGQLKLLSRDLRGSELSDAIWGQYSHLNTVRRQIVNSMTNHRKGA